MTPDKPTVALIMPEETRNKVLDPADLARLEGFATVVTPPDSALTTEALAPVLEGCDAVITGWKSPPVPLPANGRVKFLAHSAGSIRLLKVNDAIAAGRLRASASAAMIGGPVAEFTIAHMLLHLRLLDVLEEGMRRREPWAELKSQKLGRMLEDQVVGLVGAGHVGRLLIDLMKPFRPRVLVYDPYLSEEGATALGVERASLEEVFSESTIVSLHAPVIPETHHMIKDEHLSRLRDGALLINTARAAIIEEKLLIAHLSKNRFSAVLDVFEQEPLADDSPLRDMPNVRLAPHASGHSHGSYLRQGRNAVDETRRFFAGEPLLHEIAPDKVELMA